MIKHAQARRLYYRENLNPGTHVERMLLAGATTLTMATARITNPNLTHIEFNDWYNTVLLPSFMSNHNVSLGVRYKAVPNVNSSRPLTWEYLALYKTHEGAASSVLNKKWTEQIFGKQDIGPNDVTIELSSWTLIQTFESLREKRGQVPAGRPKIAMTVKIEPKEGGDEDVETWYRHQVGTTFSAKVCSLDFDGTNVGCTAPRHVIDATKLPSCNAIPVY